ncbi:MATE family efflux transporter [Oscillospiraceae bacterium N12]|jgi:putative MATE family efflux protein|uniref:Multidrug-efflux transporter n=1 Tax=Jilunia laotingensis TaxID=2763675 RepID=A0A926IR36_9BACT|nr:MATE family efflux transporter [Jilunia laotingensis]MBC8594210.1 MATE family efflux transporter [Jilunia laotingensis]
MKTKYTYKEIWLISYPILISLIMEQLIGMTDTAFLGRVGEVELGASAIAGVYYLAIFMMAFGFSIGAQILIARRNGEQRYGEIGSVFYQGIYFLLLLGAVMFFLSMTFSPHILQKIISSPHIYEAAISYINWRIFGFFFSFIMVMFRAFFVGTTQTKTLTLNSIVMVLSNVVFNYILIFGKLGFPPLGIAGAAIGSSLAELVSVLFFIIYTWKRIDCRKYGLNKLPRFQPETLKRILGVSFWTMIQNLFSMSTWFLFFLFVEHLGERALAVTNIIRNVSGIPFMVAMAFASTCGSLVSNLIGAGETSCVQGTIRQHIRIAYAFVLPLLLFFVLFPKLILSIYTDIPALQEASIPALWVLCSAYLIMVPSNVYFQSVSGTGNTRTALVMELCVLGVYVIYISYIILYLRVDVAVCWTTEHLYAILTLILCHWYIKKGNWQKKKI